MTEIENARAALAGVSESEARLADRMRWPLWRHAAPGAVIDLILFGQTLDSEKSMLLSTGVLLAVVVLRRSDMMRDGMFVSGMRRGRTAWIGLLLAALAVAALFAVRRAIPGPQTQQPAFWVLLAAMGIAATALSLVWERIYRAELRGSAR